MKSIKYIIFIGVIILSSCNSNKNVSDASGSFEAVETIISAEASGVVKQFNVQEGMDLKGGTVIGYIDSVQLYLKKKQLEAQIKAALSRRPDISTQISSLREQLRAAEKEQRRIANLLKADAATGKQADDINSQVEVIKRQISAQESSLGISSEGINKDATPLMMQIEQINDQLVKCKIINPVSGTVLVKYMEANEVTSIGKPLYKIADLSNLILRAYITDGQLSQLKLNQKVKVLVDKGTDKTQEYEGTIQWINDKSEFTPKTIPKKDERANLVYAVKIKVKNDGFLKLGMYAEVKF